MTTITFKVNGIAQTVDLEHDRVRLSEVLRTQLGLTGTKIGCGVGKCGSCTVLVDGEPVTSCTLLARKADGTEVRTIEGMADGTTLHPIQEAFLDAGAVQCGFCTPGLVMRTYALLKGHPNADDGQIVEMLRHHLCRCTGYEAILEAVRLSRGRMQSA
jgi:carbon-monoxide dehydrogenase small subunit